MKDHHDLYTLDAFGADADASPESAGNAWEMLAPLAPTLTTFNGHTLDEISDQRIAAELRRVRQLAYFQPRHIQHALYEQANALAKAQKRGTP